MTAGRYQAARCRLALCAGHHSTNTKKIYSAVLQNAKKKKYLTRNDAGREPFFLSWSSPTQSLIVILRRLLECFYVIKIMKQSKTVRINLRKAVTIDMLTK